MTTITVLSAPASGSNTGISRTFSRAAVVGSSLIAWLHHTAASTNTMTGAVDNAATAFTEDYTASDSIANEGIRVYRRTNIANAATSYTPQASVATGAYGGLLEVVGMDSVSSYVGTTYRTDNTPTNHSITFTTTTPNAIVVVGIRNNTNFGSISALSAGWSDAGLARNGADMLYNPDCGVVGSKTITFTSSTNAGEAHYYISEYRSAVSDPTVSTVTGTTVTEGGNIVFTVTLSGATNRTTNYATSLSGTATSADYNNALGSATYSDGVTASGSDLVVPSGVSSFTVTIATTQDALDEDNETLILTVGGTASTGGTITDDDATPALLIPGPVTVDSGDSVVASYTLGAVSGRVTQARLTLTDGTKVGGTNYTNTFPAATLSNGVTIDAGVLTIPAGVTGFTITIPTAG